jgi:hypothetical protein
VFLKERNFGMTKKDLLRKMEEVLPDNGEFTITMSCEQPKTDESLIGVHFGSADYMKHTKRYTGEAIIKYEGIL